MTSSGTNPSVLPISLSSQSFCRPHRKNHGVEEVHRLLHARDINGWSALEWSVEAGDINTVEYLMKKGLNPSHLITQTQHNCLHLSILHHRVDVACFLLDVGVDHTAKDSEGRTPLQLHALTQDSELKDAILNHPRVRSCCPRVCCQGGGGSQPALTHDVESGLEVVAAYRVEKNGTRSYAINRISPTRLSYLMIYASATFGLWLLSIVVPFYAYFPLVGLGGGGYRCQDLTLCLSPPHPSSCSYLSMQVGTLQSRAMHAKGRLLLSWWQQIIGAPEKYIGFWLGNIMAFTYYYLSALAYAYHSRHNNNDDDTDDHSAYSTQNRNPNHLAGLNCALKDPVLFWWTLILLAVTLISWLMIVWIFPDPGLVDTREKDFFEVMEQSLQEGGGPPNATLYCRTTLVKKPLRSKYCASSGYVVARMDHYCVWLNSAVGYKNHRTFIVFLYSHFLCCILCLSNLLRSVSVCLPL
jgi:hypothetical protein